MLSLAVKKLQRRAECGEKEEALAHSEMVMVSQLVVYTTAAPKT